MKKIFLIIIAVVFAVNIQAQKLIDTYKKGPVKLLVDETYAQDNDWEKVFETYYDTIYNTPMGDRKSIKLLPNGELVVNHEYRNYYSKFSSTGQFIKEFGVYSSSGKQFKKTKPIEGVVNQNTLFTELDNMGKMLCFDFNGNYKKTLTLDYMAKKIIALSNGKLAVVGWSIWSDKFRDFVAIVDYETNKQNIIWDNFTTRNRDKSLKKNLYNYQYKFEKAGMISFNTMPFTKSVGMSSPPQINSVNNKLVVSNPQTGEIATYSSNGHLISKSKINWSNPSIAVEEQIVMHKKTIKKFEAMQDYQFSKGASKDENKKALVHILKEMRADLGRITEPIQIPYFSTIIQDSDDNLLFFEYPKEDNKNVFNVWIYGDDGQFNCKSSFVCEAYELEINPSKMVFKDGYIYALQKKKNVQGNPLRLVRFKLTN
jgi:hypothetical protein